MTASFRHNVALPPLHRSSREPLRQQWATTTEEQEAPMNQSAASHAKPPEHTPLMRQYFAAKAEYPDTLRVLPHGRFLRAVLRRRAQGGAAARHHADRSAASRPAQPIPMAGVPYHAAEGYLARLVRLGESVAICEQIGDPGDRRKGLVERKVVRVVTPGTVTDEALLERAPRQPAARDRAPDGRTRRLRPRLGRSRRRPLPAQRSRRRRSARAPNSRACSRPKRWSPKTSRWPALRQRACPACASARRGISTPTTATARAVRASSARATCPASACDDLPLAIAAAGCLLGYVEETQKAALPHLTRPRGRERERNDRARRRDAAQPRTRHARRAAAPNTRCSACSTARSRRWARACCAAGCIGRCAIAACCAGASRPIGALHRRSAATKRCAKRCAASAISNASSRASRCARRVRAICRPCATACARCAELARRMHRRRCDSPLLQAICVDALGEHADTRGALLARAIVEQPPALLRDGGVIARRLRRRARRAAHAVDACRPVPDRPRSAREGRAAASRR